MRLRYAACESYLASLAELIERSGIGLFEAAEGDDLVLFEDDAGVLSFELVGGLPDGGEPSMARIEVREELRPVGDGWFERSRYE